MHSPAIQFLIHLATWAKAHTYPFAHNLVQNTLNSLYLLGGLFVVVVLFEKLAGANVGRYRTRTFLHTVTYYFYFTSGLHSFCWNWLFSLLAYNIRPHTPLAGLPMAIQIIVSIVVYDFVDYWWHRLQHGVPFLWAFHSTHHAQEDLTLPSGFRIHPMDHLLHRVAHLVPLAIIGAPPAMWPFLEFLKSAHVAIQHTELPWRFGPLYRIFSSPIFHSLHHSTDPAHIDKNFSVIFSAWDYAFGTAAPDGDRAPAYGVVGMETPTLVSQFVTPFKMIFAHYFRREPASVSAPVHAEAQSAAASMGSAIPTSQPPR